MYDHAITKFSRMVRFTSYGASRASGAPLKPISRLRSFNRRLVNNCFIIVLFITFSVSDENKSQAGGVGGVGGKVSPRKSVVQFACQYDVTFRVSNFQNGEQSVHRRDEEIWILSRR